MQENNNFETIITKWRRISDVEKLDKREGLEFISMSGGDSHHHTPLFGDHKKEETNFLVPESKASTSVAVIGAGAAAASDLHCDKSTKTEDEQDLIKNQENNKDASGDVDKISNDYLENNDKVISSAPDQNNEKGKDNVDSVFLRSTPGQYKRPAPPVEEEEDCGIKCLYYTLQCCDCVLM